VYYYTIYAGEYEDYNEVYLRSIKKFSEEEFASLIRHSLIKEGYTNEGCKDGFYFTVDDAAEALVKQYTTFKFLKTEAGVEIGDYSFDREKFLKGEKIT
jgi:hypothetical protein